MWFSGSACPRTPFPACLEPPMRRVRPTRPVRSSETVTAALALVLVAPLVGSAPATADEPAARRPAGSPRSARSPSPPRATSPATASTSAWPRPSRRWTPGGRSRPSPRSASTSPATPAPAASQPNLSPTWVADPGRPRLAAAAHRARPAGVVPAALPALQGRLQDLARAPPAATPRRPRRARPRPTRTPPTRRRTASAPGSTIWYDLEGFNLQRHPLPRVRAGLHVARG